MQRYQAGDEDAFTELYRLTAPAIHRYLTRWVDFSKAGDLLQETYLQMHRARRTYRAELPFRPWLYAIARNRIWRRVLPEALRFIGERLGSPG